jgi:hypothetical protein
MYGDTPDLYVANAYAYGARDFDTAAALHAMDLGGSMAGTASGDHPVRGSLTDWLTYHFVPGHAASCSRRTPSPIRGIQHRPVGWDTYSTQLSSAHWNAPPTVLAGSINGTRDFAAVNQTAW